MFGRTVREYYEEVGRKATKRGKCRCDKMRTRTRMFSQTISPFNKNKDGTLKNREEIMVEVKKEIEEWLQDTDITCEKCFRLEVNKE